MPSQFIRSERSELRRLRASLNPFSGAHQRLRGIRRAYPIHVYVIRSDHPVDVNQTAVCAARGQLLRSEALAVLEARAVSLPQRAVAAGAFADKRVHSKE